MQTIASYGFVLWKELLTVRSFTVLIVTMNWSDDYVLSIYNNQLCDGYEWGGMGGGRRGGEPLWILKIFHLKCYYKCQFNVPFFFCFQYAILIVIYSAWNFCLKFPIKQKKKMQKKNFFAAFLLNLLWPSAMIIVKHYLLSTRQKVEILQFGHYCCINDHLFFVDIILKPLASGAKNGAMPLGMRWLMESTLMEIWSGWYQINGTLILFPPLLTSIFSPWHSSKPIVSSKTIYERKSN